MKLEHRVERLTGDDIYERLALVLDNHAVQGWRFLVLLDSRSYDELCWLEQREVP